MRKAHSWRTTCVVTTDFPSVWLNTPVNISARVDYGVRALLFLASRYEPEGGINTTVEEISSSQGIPNKFLEGILNSLRTAGLVRSQRGAVGGYRLAQAPAEISVADVVRVLDGPLAAVRGERPEEVVYDGAAEHLRDVWVATRQALRSVLEEVTLQDITDNTLPASVAEQLKAEGAWQRRRG